MAETPVIGLSELEGSTRYAPLVAMGHYVRTSGVLNSLSSEVVFERRRSIHKESDTLEDILLSMLSNCHSLAQVNTKLRPERALAQSWGREHGFAEQSTMARLLDVMRPQQVAQVRQVVVEISRQIGASRQHDWSRPLLVDIDLTAMPASARAEGSSKGYFHEKGGAVASCGVSG